MEKIKWVRAGELYKNPKLVVNGGSRSDVNQGNSYIRTFLDKKHLLQENLGTVGSLQPCQV